MKKLLSSVLISPAILMWCDAKKENIVYYKIPNQIQEAPWINSCQLLEREIRSNVNHLFPNEAGSKKYSELKSIWFNEKNWKCFYTVETREIVNWVETKVTNVLFLENMKK